MNCPGNDSREEVVTLNTVATLDPKADTLFELGRASVPSVASVKYQLGLNLSLSA